MQNERGIIEIEKEGGKSKFLRRFDTVQILTMGSIKKQAEAPSTYTIAFIAGLAQGLKYEGSFKRGLKAGLLVYVSLLSANVIFNLANNIDEIKES